MPKRTTVLDGHQRRTPTLAFLDTDTYTRHKDGIREQNVNKWNWEGVRQPSIHQKKRLVSMAVMKVMETALTNHLYQFNEKVYKQITGDL